MGSATVESECLPHRGHLRVKSLMRTEMTKMATHAIRVGRKSLLLPVAIVT